MATDWAQLSALPYTLDEKALASCLEQQLNRVFAPLLATAHHPLCVDIQIPDPDRREEVERCHRHNLDLMAELSLRWEGSAESLGARFPYPWHGVFLFRQDGDDHAARFVWRAHFRNKPGLWRLWRYRGGERLELYREVFLDGSFIEREANRLDVEPRTRRGPRNRVRHPVRLLAGLLDDSVSGPICVVMRSASPKAYVAHLRERVELARPLTAFDEQDFGCQRLMTYAHFLVGRLFQTIFDACFKIDPATPDVIARAYKGVTDSASEPAAPELTLDPHALWKGLCELMPWRNLVPGLRGLSKLKLIAPFQPLNGIDALSQLMAIDRYPFQSDDLPSRYRQNHPSFRGWICPVETPESPQVGVSLHLARGVEVDLLGRLRRPPGDLLPADELGHAAALVPFYQHNDGARSMMGAKNLKQAVPIRGAHAPAVTTGAEQQVEALLDPLRSIGLVPAQKLPAPGLDLLVAYLPFFGWNFEDAIVANQRLADEGLMDWEYEVEHSEYIQPGLALHQTAGGQESPYRLAPDEPVAVFRAIHSGLELTVPSGAEIGATLLEVNYQEPPSPLFGGKLVWRLGYRRPLVIGDKLMGRYGNKGVIAQLRPPDQMPRLPDDPRLPDQLRGRPLDLVLNPLGVISRMNLGQLIETHIGLLKCLGVRGSWDDATAARAFQPISMTDLRRGFESWISHKGGEVPVIDREGRAHLMIPDLDGREIRTACPVVIGFQHIVRLRHHPPLKAQIRSGRGKNSYNLVTGQPAAGRRRRGGQRLGEMEIWAFAAHQACRNLAAILGYKSNPRVPLPSSKKAVPPPTNSGTWASIRDHLFALGIELREVPPGTFHLNWISDAELEKRGQRVESPKLWRLERSSRFGCPKCDYRLKDPVKATGQTKRSMAPQPTLGDLLRSRGSALNDNTTPVKLVRPASRQAVDWSGSWPLRRAPAIASSDTEESGGPDAECGDDSIKLMIERTQRQLTVTFEANGQSCIAQRQLDVDEYLEVTAKLLQELRLTCPKHKNQVLQDPSGGGDKFVPVPRGLADPDRVGSAKLTEDSVLPWGYIKLPEHHEHASYPWLDRSQSASAPKRHLIPVLPLRYRWQRPDAPHPEPLTYQYQRLLDPQQDQVRQRVSGKKQKPPLQEISRLLRDRLFGKGGLIRRQGLGRRVDFSGRFVIVPHPYLAWDECGVPTAALAVLLGARIAQSSWLKEQQQIASNDSALDPRVKQAYAKLSDPEEWSALWLESAQIGAVHLEVARGIIESWLNDHPHLRVILNRQPSLHRYSLMAFRPQVLPASDGLVLRIHPLVCKGFGADFDGDEMALHLPMTEAEHAEAERLLPSRTLISVADGTPLAGYDQDFVLGHYLLSVSVEGRKRLADDLAADACKECRTLLDEPSPWPKAHGMRLLNHLCACHPGESAQRIPAWMRLAFRAATFAGVSFGALDADACRIRPGSLPTDPSLPDLAALSSADKAYNDKLDRLARERLEEQLGSLDPQSSDRASGYGLAVIALSGARGDKQVRQILAARGVLLPGEIAFDPSAPLDQFLIRHSLLEGMSADEAFWAAMNARSSMIDKKLSTRKAGAMTRKLVLALWGWTVIEGDCGDLHRPRRLVDCARRTEGRICAACYGEVPGIGLPPQVWPIGLLAAQSFGERGTQLSMQSFHTGQRAMSIEDVDRFLDNPARLTDNPTWLADNLPTLTDNPKALAEWCKAKEVIEYYADNAGLTRFIERLSGITAYSRLDPRHLQLMWLAIHLSPGKSLSSAWEMRRGPLSALAGPYQIKALLSNLVAGDQQDEGKTLSSPQAEQRPDDLPFGRVLLGQAPC